MNTKTQITAVQNIIRAICIAAAVLVFASSQAHAELKLPDVPKDGNFIQDYAHILDTATRNEIGRLQQAAYERNDTPIMVVTINSMSQYGGQSYSIERFANEWFNHWQIGKRGQEDQLINRGILLLISVGDRKARIELGADWGTRWDGFAGQIMNDQIVPEFKRGDYSQGTLNGVRNLAGMAELDVDESPPASAGDFLAPLDSKPLVTTPLTGWAILILVLGGCTLLVAAYFLPDYRKWLVIAGIGVITAALLLWVVAGLVLIYMSLKSAEENLSNGVGGVGTGGGGFSIGGGGFSSGGFSGGGGASGSW